MQTVQFLGGVVSDPVPANTQKNPSSFADAHGQGDGLFEQILLEQSVEIIDPTPQLATQSEENGGDLAGQEPQSETEASAEPDEQSDAPEFGLVQNTATRETKAQVSKTGLSLSGSDSHPKGFEVPTSFKTTAHSSQSVKDQASQKAAILPIPDIQGHSSAITGGPGENLLAGQTSRISQEDIVSNPIQGRLIRKTIVTPIVADPVSSKAAIAAGEGRIGGFKSPSNGARRQVAQNALLPTVAPVNSGTIAAGSSLKATLTAQSDVQITVENKTTPPTAPAVRTRVIDPAQARLSVDEIQSFRKGREERQVAGPIALGKSIPINKLSWPSELNASLRRPTSVVSEGQKTTKSALINLDPSKGEVESRTQTFGRADPDQLIRGSDTPAKIPNQERRTLEAPFAKETSQTTLDAKPQGNSRGDVFGQRFLNPESTQPRLADGPKPDGLPVKTSDNRLPNGGADAAFKMAEVSDRRAARTNQVDFEANTDKRAGQSGDVSQKQTASHAVNTTPLLSQNAAGMTQGTVTKTSFIQTLDAQSALAFDAAPSDGFVAPLAEPGVQSSSLQTAQTMLARPEAARMIASQMAQALINTQSNKVEIALHPEELGRVRMVLSTSDLGVSVSIVAERPETLDLMRRHIDQLAEEFRELGYETPNFEFGDSDSGTASQDRSDARPFSDASGSNTSDENAESTPMKTARSTASRGLDLRL